MDPYYPNRKYNGIDHYYQLFFDVPIDESTHDIVLKDKDEFASKEFGDDQELKLNVEVHINNNINHFAARD